MKFAKIAVIGQLAVSAVLVGVFALKSSGKVGDHGKGQVGQDGKDVPALAAGHGEDHKADKADKADKAGGAAAEGAHAEAGDEAEHGEGHGEKADKGESADKGARLAQAGHGKETRETKDSRGAGKSGRAEDHGPVGVALAGDGRSIARALLAGNERFVSGKSAHPDLEQQREESAKGQHPGVMILGCADSRVSPELVFDRGIGELFVVRSAGNIAEPVSVGSLEYAFEHLHAKVLLVMGHENCGAVKAALSDEKMPTPNLEAMVGYVAPAVQSLKAWAEGDDLVHMGVEANVRRQADEVLKRSPLLRQAAAKGQLIILKAVYDLETGRVRPI
jgi:carbonic anhydrase